VAYFEGHPKFLNYYLEAYHHGLLALHNFIRDSNLCDKEFDRCDTDEDYLLQSGMTEDESHDVENHDTMNIICTRIADALVSAGGG